MATFGSVKEKTFTLIEQGEYVLTLSELEESAGQWGDRMIWKFLVAPQDDPTAYIARDDGEEKTVWAFTDRDIILGSLGHELVENLTRRKFGEDTEPPDEDDLLDKRCVGYITHETPTRGKNAGKKREAIVAGSIKPFKGLQPKNKVTLSAPAKVEPTEAETERADLETRIAKLIARAVKLETPNHLEYGRLSLAEADMDQLEMLAATIKDEVQNGLDT